MSKNNFKKSIQEKYKGRGNTWVKIPFESKAFEEFSKCIPECDDGKSFKLHIEREGFGWARFSKVEGTEDAPLELFEVRFKGSKIDHPDNIMTLSHDISFDLPLLGNTPVKLQLEVDPSERKQKDFKKVILKRNVTKESKEVIEEYSDIPKEIRIIKEAALTAPSDKELEHWYEFLKLNDLYEDNV